MQSMKFANKALPLLPRPLPVSDLTQQHNVSLLGRAVRDLTFLPVLGPECATLGRRDTEEWRRIRDDFLWLRSQIPSGELEAADFLERFAAAQGVELGSNAQPEHEQPPELMGTLRLELLRLLNHVVGIFGQERTHSTGVVLDATDRRVETSAVDPLAARLIATCQAAHALCQTDEEESAGEFGREPPSLFAASGVRDRLVELTKKVTSGYLPDQTRSRTEHSLLELLTPVAVDSPKKCTLYAYNLDWLANLFWYTFRAQRRLYPTNAEMAFQMAVLVHESDRTPGLVYAAAHAHDWLSASLSTWLAHYDTASPPRDAYFDAIALVLWRQWDRWRVGGLSSARDPAEPVVFSTSFDLGVEHALRRARPDDPIHVVIPVLAESLAHEPPGVHLCWLLGTLEAGVAMEQPAWEPIPDLFDAAERLRGPLVVKLHGSPLHHVPEPTDEALLYEGHPQYERFDHALTLSESNYMLYLVLLNTVPEALGRMLSTENRVLFFLGQPIDEWNTRLRIFDHVYPLRKDAPNQRTMVAVEARFDLFESATLADLGIQRWKGTLEEFARLLVEQSQMNH